MPIPRVTVIGSANTDLVLECPRLPRPGETLLGGVFRQSPGGKGANQAVAAARAGARVSFVGARGDDEYGRRITVTLRRERVDLRHFRMVSGVNSGLALILLGGRTRQNLIGVARSANDRVDASQIIRAEASLRASGSVLCQLEVPLVAVVQASRIAARHSVPFILNPAPARPLPAALLRRVDCLVPNEHEAAALTGEASPRTAALKLLALGCKSVAVTLGSDGVLWADAGGCRHIKAPRVRVLDTVGAGDCFCGWLAWGIAAGLPGADAAAFAVRAASVSVTRRGALEAMPLAGEVK